MWHPTAMRTAIVIVLVIRRACGPGRVRTVLVFGGVFLSCSSLIVGVPGGPGRRKIEVRTMFGLGPMMVTSFWTMLWLSWGRLFRGPKNGPQIYEFSGPKMDPNCAETNSKWVSAKRPSIEPRKTQKKLRRGMHSAFVNLQKA